MAIQVEVYATDRREEEGMEGLEEGDWLPHFFSIIGGAVKS